MKAIISEKYGSPDVLKLVELEKPVPGDDDVLIKINATTVTAVDSTFRKGNSYFARFATGITKPKIKTLGTELAGEIESVGKNVKLFKKGDSIFGDSGSVYSAHAEYICLNEKEPLVLKPKNLTDEEAAGVSYGALTALPFLRDNGKIQAGQKILIIGASGSVGNYAVQLAKYFGAEVTGVCSTENVELVRSIGADDVIDYTKEDFAKTDLSYDIIFDTVGKSSYPQCIKILKPKGIYLTTVIGLPILMQMLWTSMIRNRKAILALTGLRPASEKLKDLHFIKILLQEKKLKPVIDRCYSLEQITEAHAYVDKGHKKGNVVITITHNNGN